MAGTESEPAHPAVLDELARGFTEHGYDLRWLIRAITATKAYHLTSARSHPSQDDPKLFARMAVRGLTGPPCSPFTSRSMISDARSASSVNVSCTRYQRGSVARSAL